MEKLRKRKKPAIDRAKAKNVKDKYLPYGLHWIDEDDIQEVLKVLKSDWITQGPKVKEFEEKLASYCGAKYVVAVSSGTAALHLACLVLRVKPGDEIITSPITFLATSNSVLYCGGKPIFVDIDEKTYNIDGNKIEEKINKNTKGIIPVDFAGQPCDLEKIRKIAKKYHLWIMEDAAHALGAEYNGKKIGGLSDLTIFSFHPVKAITTGEGGAIATNNSVLYERLLMLRSHGVTKDSSKFKIQNAKLKEEQWYYEMQELGYNYRITDFQCALGISQLKKLDKFIERRREIAQIYNEAFKNIREMTIPYEKPNVKSACHLYVLQIDFEKIGKTRKQLFEYMRANNILLQVHYIPVYLQPYYQQNLEYKGDDCCIAEKFYGKAVSLPLFPKMTNPDIKYVIEKLKSFLD